ncbi:hypothetical protein [Arthrobacter cavernae]|uniref:hypothetical protein n=1 Tax=Arthrobacter cavernae TaxID=2817681 RepID=UPI0027DB61F6|nr:hypothetical protein [Arthrobacter cavernae]
MPTTDWISAKPHERHVLATAAVGLALDGPVFYGETAAVVLGLPTLRVPQFVDVATDVEGKTGRRPGTFTVLGGESVAEQARNAGSYPLKFHLRRNAEPVCSGVFQSTGLVDTALDVMRHCPFSNALVVADGVARLLAQQGQLAAGARLVDHPDVAAGLDGIRAVATQQRAIRVAAMAHALAESAGESYSRAVIELLGFEQPAQQKDFSDSSGFVGRSDFWWPEQRVVGEFDGRGKYLDEALGGGDQAGAAVYREKLREDRIRDLGMKVVRWNWADLERPGRLRAKLLRAGLRPRPRGLPADSGACF